MTLKGLNWRKGLFRLWLLLSVLWVVAIGTFGLYPAMSRYIERVKASHELQSLRASINYKFLEEPGEKPNGDSFGKSQPSGRPALKGLTDDQMQALKKVLSRVSPDFAGLPEAEQTKVISYFNAHYFTPRPRGKSYKVQESHTGVTVVFDWYQAEPPPSETSLFDEVFRLSLGQQEIIWDKSSMPRKHGEDLSSMTDEELAKKAGIPLDEFQPIWAVPSRHEKLSDSESALLSKLHRMGELKKSMESRKNGKQELLFFFGITLSPPIAVLILGIGFMWVFSGFAPKQSG